MGKQAYERFTVFDNWGEIFDELDDQTAIELFRGMYRYAFYNEEPEFPKGSVLSLTWKAIKPNIDSSGKAAKNGSAKTPRNTSRETAKETPEKTPSETPEKTPLEQKKRKEEEEKGKGMEKKGKENSLEKNSLPRNESGSAAAGGPAPPSSPACPKCGSRAIGTNSTKLRGDGSKRRLFVCPDCAEEVWEP